MIYVVDLTIETAEPITADMLEAVSSVGGNAAGTVGERRLETTLSVDVEQPSAAIAMALRSIGEPGEIIAAEVMTEAQADRRLAEPAFPELVGLLEVAELFGISRQRVYVLRDRHEFPAPIAILGSGPVWRKGDLSTFAEGWKRKAGRPRKAA